MAEEREGGDITAADMLIPEELPSNIQPFYAGSSIFITGASGLLGQLLVEKLLRSCPDLDHIYILMRAKNDKTIQERFDSIFNDVLFDRLHLEHPKFYEKISVIQGDCEQENLGISESNLELISRKVDIVFHVASTVRFDEKLRTAVNINVRSTIDLLQIAKTMPKLRAFVYVSTAFSNWANQQVKEILYDPPITCDKLINICATLDDPQLEAITALLVGNLTNTYAYTKAIAENAVKIYTETLPVTIVRPSIVISTAKEPVSGWINNYCGTVGIILDSGLGLLHTLQCNPNYFADVIPADYVVNTLIAAAWQIGTIQSDNLNEQNPKDMKEFQDIVCDNNIPIYNNVSSVENPITWQKFMDMSAMHVNKFPSVLCIWYYCLFLNKNKYVNMIYAICMHLIPGVLVDGARYCIGKKPVMLKAYKKAHKFSSVLTYFTCKQWNFRNQNTQALWKKLNKTDKRLFDFNVPDLDWNAFFYTFLRGGRVYLLKDPLDTLPRSRVKFFKLKIAHYTLVSLVLFACLRIAVVLARYLF